MEKQKEEDKINKQNNKKNWKPKAVESCRKATPLMTARNERIKVNIMEFKVEGKRIMQITALI